ncbi:hypothetical protein A2U01_0073974, partial [Trifolium medium]|nr:hypothetical protein [Trifolium medium]
GSPAGRRDPFCRNWVKRTMNSTRHPRPIAAEARGARASP